ncbi:hypothetical protein KPL40_19050, partial [Clostridium gasigenes]|uniref:RHS repeat domain-containing protein n=1 Tax=Clostridium gasigenes TaxID=94869 RepID=UPI001C0AE038
NITGITDGNGNETSYILDDWGRITQITTPEGGTEKYTYDFAGNITSTTDANGGRIEYFYNNLGQVSEIKDQEGNSEYFYYDNEGNLTKHIDRNQNHVDRKYNIDRNIIDLKAYTVNQELMAIDAKQAEEDKKNEEENAKNIALTKPLAPSHNRFTERIKRQKEKQLLEEQNPKVIEDLDKYKINIVNQRFNYNADGTLNNAYTGNMIYNYTYNKDGILESKSASGKTLISYTYDGHSEHSAIKVV